MDITEGLSIAVDHGMRGGSGRVVVIGAGAGGLAAAMALAAEGLHVTVLERAAGPGGKMREVPAGEARIDGGPTVFTMKSVFEALFDRCGLNAETELNPTKLEILARHAWTQGGRLDLLADVAASTNAIGAFAGAREAAAYRGFAEETAAIYRLLDASFMRAPKPSVWRLPLNVLAQGAAIADLFRLRSFETLWGALNKRFSDPRLIQLFGRYATYVGSSPLAAPATLMLIAHAEQRGVWTVAGGMHQLAQAMQRAAEGKGASFRFGTGVRRIVTGARGVEAVETDQGERIPAAAIVYNGDAAALAAGLLGEPSRTAAGRPVPRRRSLSAAVSCRFVATDGFPLTRHNVFFQPDYAQEFADIFGARRMPERPTVYVCAQDRGDAGLPSPGPERLQILVNAPAELGGRAPSPEEIDQCLSRATQAMACCGLTLSPGPATLTGPQEFAQLFPGTGGAIYGQASHGMMSPFRRPGSRSRVPGLYLAGGSVHPGPGVPMATLSGWLAAEAILADLTSRRPSRQGATLGGMSTR